MGVDGCGCGWGGSGIDWSFGVCPTRVRVRKWDVHIHCDQHFQFSVFEILVLFSFDLVFGPVE